MKFEMLLNLSELVFPIFVLVVISSIASVSFYTRTHKGFGVNWRRKKGKAIESFEFILSAVCVFFSITFIIILFFPPKPLNPNTANSAEDFAQLYAQDMGSFVSELRQKLDYVEECLGKEEYSKLRFKEALNSRCGKQAERAIAYKKQVVIIGFLIFDFFKVIVLLFLAYVLYPYRKVQFSKFIYTSMNILAIACALFSFYALEL